MSFAGVHTLVLQRDGACLRERVARRAMDGRRNGHRRKSFDDP